MCVFSLTFQGGNQLLFQHSQLLYVLAKCNERSPLVIINRDYSWLVGWFVPIFSVPRVTKRAYVQLWMLCYIQNPHENPHEKKIYQRTTYDGTMDVGLLSYHACAYVYDICMSVRRGCWCRMLDVDSTNNEFFQNRKENTIILNERRIWAVESLSSRRRKLDILSNSTKTSLISKK